MQLEPQPAQTELLEKVKEIKLQLPLRTHVSLHSIKLLKNQSIRDSVVVALDRFFRDHPVEAAVAAATEAA